MSDKTKKRTLSPWMSGFLTSLLGTTISIALTFGTTAWLNANKKKDAQRQTAMMVIHDINTTIKSMEASRDELEKNYESVKYFLEYMDKPEAADQERLEEAISGSLRILIDTEQKSSLNESTEKIFSSSMDAWSNLDNMRFIENVQSFYYARRAWLDHLNTSFYWKGPVSEQEMYNQVAVNDYTQSYTLWGVWGQYLTAKMKDKAIRYYLDVTPNKISEMNSMIQSWSDMNEENMFLMGITDEELNGFVKQMENKNAPLNERDLVGTWINSQSVNNSVFSEIEFRADNTFEVRDTTLYNAWQFRGKIKVSYSIEGKWEIQKDSLIRFYDAASIKTVIDTTGISVSENMKEAVASYIKNLSDYYERDTKQYFESNPRAARMGSFDLTRNKMELTSTTPGENGEPETQTSHYKRK